MSNMIQKLGEAEVEIMQVLWDSTPPVTSNYILKELQGRRKWQLSTLMTSLSRLEHKGFIVCDRTTGMNLYRAAVPESDYKTKAGKHFLEKLYNNSIRNMVASLYNSNMIKESDLAELRSYLDALERETDGEES